MTSPESYWTILYKKKYNIDSFLSVHPGGDILRLAIGIDATPLFESYHPGYKLKQIQRVLQTLPILETYPQERDLYKTDIKGFLFYHTLRQRVEEFILQKGMTRFEYQYIYIIETFFTWFLYWITALESALTGSWWISVLCGITMTRIAFITHTGNHCAASSFTIVNRTMGQMINWIGANQVVWKHEHQISHHLGLFREPREGHLGDNDFQIAYPFLRLHPTQRFRWWNIFQPIILFIGIFLKWIIFDGVILFKQRDTLFSNKWIKWIHFFISKGIWWTVHLIAPILFHGPVVGLSILFVKFGIIGYYLGQLFLVAHLGEWNSSQINNSSRHWSVKQVYSTRNWSSGSMFSTWISGGLNHQIEHHLFPQIHPYLYPIISPVVKEVCKEHNLPYQTFPSFISAWWNTICHVCKNGFLSFYNKTNV